MLMVIITIRTDTTFIDTTFADADTVVTVWADATNCYTIVAYTISTVTVWARASKPCAENILLLLVASTQQWPISRYEARLLTCTLAIMAVWANTKACRHSWKLRIGRRTTSR